MPKDDGKPDLAKTEKAMLWEEGMAEWAKAHGKPWPPPKRDCDPINEPPHPDEIRQELFYYLNALPPKQLLEFARKFFHISKKEQAARIGLHPADLRNILRDQKLRMPFTGKKYDKYVSYLRAAPIAISQLASEPALEMWWRWWREQRRQEITAWRPTIH